MANAPARGWRLPIFIAGVAMIVKAPTGIGLLSGLGLALAVRAAAERTVRPLLPAAAAAGLFASVYALFWFLPGSTSATGLELHPLYHLQWLEQRGDLAGFGADVAWLLAPGLIALLPVGPALTLAHPPLLRC